MTLIARLLRPRGDDCAAVRPLWRRIVELARDRRWYAEDGIADSLAGRFDAVALVLSLVLLRLERDDRHHTEIARLTELFVADMEGQLRESGVGDLVVGKHVGKLMGMLGGRLGSLRAALASADSEALVAAVARNVTLAERGDPARVAARVRGLADALAAADDGQVLGGSFAL